MSVVSRQVGEIEVVALYDGAGEFFAPRAEAFAGASAGQWERADSFDPRALNSFGEWVLQFRCFALKLPSGRVILVDAGIGPAGAPASAWAPTPGLLPESLAEAGIEPGDIDQVVLTHLHTDHIGWSVGGLFPGAAVLVQRAELGWITPELREMVTTERLVLLDGDSGLATGVKVVATPGHTPGHQSVLVDSGDQLLAVTGDLLVHALQLVAPEVGYQHEMDVDAARRSRVDLLDQVRSRGGELATPHLTDPFVRPVTPR